MLIEGCTFDTGDDCIALKSGRNDDGRRVNVPIENVVIRNCTMKDGHGGVVIGSEMSGGARNVFAETLPHGQPATSTARSASRPTPCAAASSSTSTCATSRSARWPRRSSRSTSSTRKATPGSSRPSVREIDVRNVTSGKSQYALLLRGYAHTPMRDIRVTDCTFDNVANDDVIEGVTGLTLKNVRVNGKLRNETISR